MFYADLHVHSKFSRATSRDCDLEHLAVWAARKGIRVVATGDFTHPGWFAEIEEKLIPAEPGLFRLRPESQRQVDALLGGPSAVAVRFILEVEISTIYKKDDRTRKVHHLVYAPDLDSARRVTERLSRIGNLKSDGRPILGLDSRDLLEIALESGDGCYLVPAHIWTPWFAVLGSKSGFDWIEHCYGDLSPHIFALETGLSSDPPMNWRLSRLDRYALVSNSDAHSPAKLGREACVFDTGVDYFAMRRALETGEGYAGTVEFFPEEGKYHLDGHRKCGVCLEPDESRRYGGKCPACGKPLTLGVMHRVCELADRDEVVEPLPPRAAPVRSFIPLTEVLSEIQGVGPQSKAVERKYDDLIHRLGPELFILEDALPEDIRRAGSPLLAEALTRMRLGQVIRHGGYDGEYGTIRLFSDDELRRHASVGLLFELPDEPEESVTGKPSATVVDTERTPAAQPADRVEPPAPLRQSTFVATGQWGILEGLDPQQRAAAEIVDGPLLIVAGPGTGKTRTLTHRLAHLIADRGVAPEQCLAVTFSRRAAGEMIERLETLLPGRAERVPVMTFHALGLSILREHAERLGLPDSVHVASEADRVRLLRDALSISERKARATLQSISRYKRRGIIVFAQQTERRGGRSLQDRAVDRDETRAVKAYQELLKARAWVDFDDLVLLPVGLLRDNGDLAEHYRSRHRWVCVDEYQDIDAVQYELARLLVSADGNLCAIGDPDQAIYGFRGADVGFFQRFCEDFPSARTVALSRNYRSTRTIVDAASQLIAPASLVLDRQLEAMALGPEQIEIHGCGTERAEAEFVVHTTERMIGGSTFFSMDSRRVESHEGDSLSFADVAVLYRTDAQADALVEAFARSGMPFQRRSHRPLAEAPAVQAAVAAMIRLRDTGSPGRTVVQLLDLAIGRLEQPDPQAEPYLAALRALAARFDRDLPGFLSELALGVDADVWDPRADRVSLLTLHAAKGLEFPVVFIVGCEDGIIPLHFGPDDEQDTAEERRLFFVGMTRAQHRLILTHARRRRWRGKVRPSTPSPFLRDIQQQLLAQHDHRLRAKRPPQQHQPLLFDC